MATAEEIRPGIEGRLERVVEGDLLTHHVGGKGTFRWVVTLKKGTYRYVCDPHASFMKGSFTVS